MAQNVDLNAWWNAERDVEMSDDDGPGDPHDPSDRRRGGGGDMYGPSGFWGLFDRGLLGHPAGPPSGNNDPSKGNQNDGKNSGDQNSGDEGHWMFGDVDYGAPSPEQVDNTDDSTDGQVTADFGDTDDSSDDSDAQTSDPSVDSDGTPIVSGGVTTDTGTHDVGTKGGSKHQTNDNSNPIGTTPSPASDEDNLGFLYFGPTAGTTGTGDSTSDGDSNTGNTNSGSQNTYVPNGPVRLTPAWQLTSPPPAQDPKVPAGGGSSPGTAGQVPTTKAGPPKTKQPKRKTSGGGGQKATVRWSRKIGSYGS